MKDSDKSLLLMMAMDIAILLSELPASLRSLHIHTYGDDEIIGQCSTFLLDSLWRFQELEEAFLAD